MVQNSVRDSLLVRLDSRRYDQQIISAINNMKLMLVIGLKINGVSATSGRLTR